MPLYRIREALTKRPLGLYSAVSERDALDMCARAYGCTDYLSSHFCPPDGRRSLVAELMSNHGTPEDQRGGLTVVDQLREALRWLALQPPELSHGLRTAEDAIALWRAWYCDQDLPDMLASPKTVAEAKRLRRFFSRTIGYSPIPLPEALASVRPTSR
jgi:hypothetical protein